MDLSKFDLNSFKRVQEQMISTNEQAWENPYFISMRNTKLKNYTPEEIQRIIDSGSPYEQSKLSRNYFYKDGFYRRIILYYATLLKYAGLVIPNVTNGSLSKSSNQKKYNQVLNYIDEMNLPAVFTNCSWRALVDGCYYGVICTIDRNSFAMMDLPYGYCCTRFKDFKGNDVIEFDVTYFDTITDETKREEALAIYPKVISQHYRKWNRGKTTYKWVCVPTDIGVCFPLFDNRPLFLNVIPATIQYDQAVDVERERDLEEIRKIIVQKIPHLSDGGLLFEPEEAQVIHAGTVGMMKNNKNVSVLTTYADVDAIVSKTSSDTSNTTLTQMEQNIYAQAGVTSQVFAATGNLSVEISIKNDISLMMVLANRYSGFITSIINRLFGNQGISFKYNIYPISYYNESSYITDSFKLASSGYSFLLPALAMGINQRDIVNLKDLENDMLGLADKLKPLSSAFTSSSGSSGTGTGEVGRPEKDDSEKSAKTLANEESLDSQGGSK